MVYCAVIKIAVEIYILLYNDILLSALKGYKTVAII